MLFGNSLNLVGLDIGESAVKVVELKDLGKGRGFQLAKLGWEPLAPEAIVDGQIMDATVVVETIQRLFYSRNGPALGTAAMKCSEKSVINDR